MSDIQCFLAQVNAGILPAGLAGQLPAEIATHYSTGSKGVIDLVVAQSPVPPVFPIKEPVGAYYLHDMLGAVTGNQTHPPKIAVLYASSYAIATPGVLGVMFDRGFTTDDDPNPVNQPARLGCAVFLDSIRRLRGDGANFTAEAIFTTLHELGHVFNLWHIEDGRNIMSTSRENSVIPRGLWVFEDTQKNWLATHRAVPS